MTRTKPWMKFYPADWRADQALRACCLSARGFWLECMCIMHEADPYGHLLINGRPATDVQLSTITGSPLDQIPGLLDELENAGVFSRTRNRTIYSRRMTRDEKSRKDGEKASKIGGKIPNSRRSQAIENVEEKLPPPRGTGGGTHQPPPGTHMPETRKKESKSVILDEPGPPLNDRRSWLSQCDPDPRPIDRPQDPGEPTPAAIIRAFDAQIVEKWGAHRRRQTRPPADLPTATRMHEAGADFGVAWEIFGNMFDRMVSRGMDPPGNLRYCETEVLRAMTARVS